MDAVTEHLRRNLGALQANLRRSVQDAAAQAAALCQGALMPQPQAGLAPLLAVSPWRRRHAACGIGEGPDGGPHRAPRPPGPRSAAAAAAAACPQSVSARVGGAAAAARRRAQPLLELAFNPEDLKARLDAVRVWVVVNNKNEFVLVAGEVRGPRLPAPL